MLAQKIRTIQFYWSEHRQNGLRAQLLIVGGMAAGTGNGSPAFLRRVVLQQFCECGSPSLMHRRADDGFDGFQIDAASLAAIPKDRVQQTVYFAGDFLLDRFGSFFS